MSEFLTRLALNSCLWTLDSSIMATPLLDREEYIEQAYFFRVFRERLAESLPTQEKYACSIYSSRSSKGVAMMQSEMTDQQRKGRIDKLAAQVMLQTFLDAPDRQAKPAAI